MKECFRCAKVLEYYEPATPLLTKGVFGIDIVNRGKNDNHPVIVLFAEDDGHYWEIARFSHDWIDCLINLLTEAKKKVSLRSEE